MTEGGRRTCMLFETIVALPPLLALKRILHCVKHRAF